MLSPPPKKKPVCSLFYQQRAKNHYKNLALGWLYPSWGLPFLLRTAGGCGGRAPLPKLGGQMAFPWLRASSAWSRRRCGGEGEDVPAEVRPLLIPTLRPHGMERDPAASPGKMHGGGGGTRAQHANSHCSSLQVHSLSASSVHLRSHFWGESRLFLLAPYILRGVGPAGSCPHRCRIREEQRGPTAGTEESTGDPSEAHPILRSICTSVGSVFGGFHPSPRNEKPFYCPERSRLLPGGAVGRPDPSRCGFYIPPGSIAPL